MNMLSKSIREMKSSATVKRSTVIEFICAAFILLFVYAALMKLLDVQKFITQLGQSPMLMAFAPLLAIAVPAIELLVAAMFFIRRLRLVALYASFSLMVAFTIYIIVILTYAEHVPCSCAGILEDMTWKQHLVFNILFVAIAAVGIILLTTQNAPVANAAEARPSFSRKTPILLACCTVLSTGVVITLYAATHKILHEPNNFLRIHQKGGAQASSKIDVEYNSYYIAGLTQDHVYLGNVTQPWNVLILDPQLKEKQLVTFDIKNEPHATLSPQTTVAVEGNEFVVADGSSPAIFRGYTGDWLASRLTLRDTFYFNQFLPIKNGFAFRTNSAATHEHILGTQLHSQKIKLDDQLLQKQVDGFFCTDGILKYDKELGKLIYIYRYRNQYIVYDSSLNLSYRGNTIDTFSRAQIKISPTTSAGGNSLTYKKTINRNIATSGRYLYVNSDILAKNDPTDMLELSSVIDVYDLTNNTYRFSFTLVGPDPKFRLGDFKVLDNKILVAVYDNYLVKFDLHLESEITQSTP